MPIDVTEYAEAINNALTEGSFCVLSTCGEAGPDIGFKGSMQVFDTDSLCFWERTRGGHLANAQIRVLPSCTSAVSAGST